MSTLSVFDDTRCSLGEGALWHPLRQQFFWFDINAYRLYSRTAAGRQMWQFDEYVSAAGWIDHDRLLIATETALVDFNIEAGTHTIVSELEADNSVTRCNDGRADPHGGFWIGTMGKNLETGVGAIYRYYRGELRKLYPDRSIPNATCFTPDGDHAYFTDTPTGKVWKQALDGSGWPKGDPELFLNLPAENYRTDGAVIDEEGNFWSAQYGHGKISVFSPDRVEVNTIRVPGARPTCPAFGGADMNSLFVTTASQKLENPTEHDGRTYVLETNSTGQTEHQVVL